LGGARGETVRQRLEDDEEREENKDRLRSNLRSRQKQGNNITIVDVSMRDKREDVTRCMRTNALSDAELTTTQK